LHSTQTATLCPRDALTGLPNRRSLIADLESWVPEASAERPVLLAIFDLNGFKDYNDTHGHQGGDLQFGPDGKLYWGQGCVTNMGVVGADNFRFEWLATFPEVCVPAVTV
jgi:predicted signal transduction protein with EAL and GGDEF domain